jgi:hypothetical protein
MTKPYKKPPVSDAEKNALVDMLQVVYLLYIQYMYIHIYSILYLFLFNFFITFIYLF